MGVGNVSPRAFRIRTVRYWHPLGCRAIEHGTPLQGGVMYTVVHGRVSDWQQSPNKNELTTFYQLIIEILLVSILFATL